MQKVKLTAKRWIATSTAEFVMEKPKGYKFAAGQYFDVRLPGKDDAPEEAALHHFTIASSPREETLSFATRMRHSVYKDSLDSLDTGAELEISEASGDFLYWPSSGRSSVFIAGGIGITPFRSILNDAAAEMTEAQIILLYSNRRPQDAAFLQELQELAEDRSNLRLIATITEPDFAEMKWDGETGHIDDALLGKAAPQIGAAEFYIAGPPGMVDAMQSLVEKAGAPKSRIHAEQFAGYEERPGQGTE